MIQKTRTQIVATIGPSSGDSPEMLASMLDNGMDVARINFSHGTHESNGGYIKNIRAIAQERGVHVPVIMDLAGPRMQTEGGHAFNGASHEVISDKDRDDLAFAVELGLEYIAQSYVGGVADVAMMREEIAKKGGSQKLIAKIERQEAINDFDAILAISDAIMIARGDLGLAVPVEEIPFIQRDLVQKAKRAEKPIITATQMMYSMVENPDPTRAEVTDVAYAILLGSDAVMLSDETARGKHPLEAVSIMDRIVRRAETDRLPYVLNLL
ncbi:hypothetical protein FJY94_04000 [Candidatus Kaiserbacteria bacterium]|nr:hypothetical protein [Candidatus Kaiserbacteria bacterium]